MSLVNIPPSELMTLFNPALISPLSGETNLYARQSVGHRYKQHFLTQNIRNLSLGSEIIFSMFGLFSTLVEQAKEVSFYFQNNPVGIPDSALSS